MTPAARTACRWTIVAAAAFSSGAVGDDKPSEEEVVALRDFQKLYALNEGEDFKWIGTPFPASRRTWYQVNHNRKASEAYQFPNTISFQMKDDQLKFQSMTYGASLKLAGLLEAAFDVPFQDVKAPPGVREKDVAGDFVFRQGADRDHLLEVVAAELKSRIKLPLKMRFAEIERQVYVASGAWKFKPNVEGSKRVDVFGDIVPLPEEGARNSGDMDRFLRYVGGWIDRPVVRGSIEDAPKMLQWRTGIPPRFTDELNRANREPKAVVSHLEQQTGLIFREETRKVRTLVVELDE